MEDIEKYKRAKERVVELKGFYLHLIVYGLVNLSMFIYNLVVSPDYYWFVWPMVGWGIGLSIHALSVFLRGKIFGKGWEDKKIQELMNKDNI